MANESHPNGPILICSTAGFFSRPLGEAFGHIADAGFGGVEVMVTRDPATQQAHVLRELSRKHGLAIRAIHAPFLLMTRKVWGSDPIGKIDRSVELARETGASLVVVHPPYRWQAEYRRWVDERLPDLTGQRGILVGMENMFPVRLRGGRGVRLHARQSIHDLDPYPHVVLDTSHAAVSGLDAFEVQHGQAAESRQRAGKRGIDDRVHRGGEDRELEALLVAEPDLAGSARAVVDAALERGSRDNCTALVVEYRD